MRSLRPVGPTLREVASGLRRHDLALYAGGLTFYGTIALLPATLVALRLAGVLIGPDRVARLGGRVADALPDSLGAPALVARLIAAGAHLSVLTLLVALLPSTLYGEGLRRAFARMARTDESYTGWRGRAGVLPLLLVTPLMAVAILLAAPTLAHLTSSGRGGTALAVYLALVLDWLLLSVPLTYIYRVLSPAEVSWRAASVGALVTASFVSGFLQGFVLFLSIPLDLGLPFGGYTAVGAMVAVSLWLWVLHLLVLVGHQLVMVLDRPAVRVDGAQRAAAAAGLRSETRGSSRSAR